MNPQPGTKGLSDQSDMSDWSDSWKLPYRTRRPVLRRRPSRRGMAYDLAYQHEAAPGTAVGGVAGDAVPHDLGAAALAVGTVVHA